MPRTERIAPGGMVFHVLNRGAGRMRLFLKDADFEAFERAIEKTFTKRRAGQTTGQPGRNISTGCVTAPTTTSRACRLVVIRDDTD